MGETGGKDFIVAHASADGEALLTAIMRGGFEYQGQKCSAVSRVYLPDSMWKDIKDDLIGLTAELTMGDIADFRNFMGAVIDQKAFDKSLARAHGDFHGLGAVLLVPGLNDVRARRQPADSEASVRHDDERRRVTGLACHLSWAALFLAESDDEPGAAAGGRGRAADDRLRYGGRMQSTYHIIIVGASVAGASSAIALAPSGYRILLLDQATFPRDKPCGEGVMPQGVQVLAKLGVLPDILAHPGSNRFSGIRYRSRRGVSAAADFPGGGVFGVVLRRWYLIRGMAVGVHYRPLLPAWTLAHR